MGYYCVGVPVTSSLIMPLLRVTTLHTVILCLALMMKDDFIKKREVRYKTGTRSLQSRYVYICCFNSIKGSHIKFIDHICIGLKKTDF